MTKTNEAEPRPERDEQEREQPPLLVDFEGYTDEQLAELPEGMRRLALANRAESKLAKVDLISADLTHEVAVSEMDKRDWGDGPWQNEPDLLMWIAKAPPHYRCQITRSFFGSLCGYVAIPPGHPAHGVYFADGRLRALGLPSHRGLSYSGEATHGHWVFGFDCGHGFDIQPAADARWLREMSAAPDAGRPAWMRTAYRDMPYVRGIVEQLAAALAAITTLPEPALPEGEQ